MLGNSESIKFVVNDNNEVAVVSVKSSIDNKINYVKSILVASSFEKWVLNDKSNTHEDTNSRLTWVHCDNRR